MKGAESSSSAARNGRPFASPPAPTRAAACASPARAAPARRRPRGRSLLTIHVTPHPFFKRDGDDLYLDVPVTLGEAYRGEKIRIPTPDGEVTLKVPRHTQSGSVTRLRGKGVARKGKEPATST